MVQDDSFLQKFGKLRQITEGVTVVLLDRYSSTPSCTQSMLAPYGSSGSLRSIHQACDLLCNTVSQVC